MNRVTTLPQRGRLYCDTSVWIYAVERVEPMASVLTPVFGRADAGAFEFVTSELTRLEVLVKPISSRHRELAMAYEVALSPGPGVDIVPVSRIVLVEAARLRADCGMRTPDAIHLATAVASKVDLILTNDATWAALPGLPPIILPRDLAAER